MNTFILRKKEFLFKIGLFALGCILCNNVNAQVHPNDSLNYNHKKRLGTMVIGGSVLYAGTMITLNQLWYADFERSSFHFFDDNDEWLQMDKVGHVTTAYHFSKAAKNGLLWAGMKPSRARNYGAAYGFIFQSTLEILDGFSTEWGASWGDMVANTAGIGLMWTQDALWNEQRFNLKYSYHQSPYAHLRPNTFGHTAKERLLKDYNGQNYWLSANIASFIQEENNFPKWINLAAGYGIDGVIGANTNPINFGNFTRNRQYLLSLDVDLERIETRSKFLKFMFSTLSFIKIPAPTIEVTDGTTKFHWLYF